MSKPSTGKTSKSPRKKVDWEACEREYRTGSASNCQLAQKYGCTEAAIRDRAKRYQWQKDLSEAVRQATKAKLLRAELRESDPIADSQIVDSISTVQVAVQLGHRKSIKELDGLKGTLAARAAALIDGVVDLKSLNDAAGAVESLGRTVARLIPLERQAFNMDEPATDGASSARAMTSEERQAEIAALLAKVRPHDGAA